MGIMSWFGNKIHGEIDRVADREADRLNPFKGFFGSGDTDGQAAGATDDKDAKATPSGAGKTAGKTNTPRTFGDLVNDVIAEFMAWLAPLLKEIGAMMGNLGNAMSAHAEPAPATDVAANKSADKSAEHPAPVAENKSLTPEVKLQAMNATPNTVVNSLPNITITAPVYVPPVVPVQMAQGATSGKTH